MCQHICKYLSRICDIWKTLPNIVVDACSVCVWFTRLCLFSCYVFLSLLPYENTVDAVFGRGCEGSETWH